MNIFAVAFALGLFLPLVGVAAAAYLWRGLIEHMWWFLGLGVISLYVLMVVCITSAFANLGISGAVNDMHGAAFDPTYRYLVFMAGWLVSSALALWGIRYVLSKF